MAINSTDYSKTVTSSTKYGTKSPSGDALLNESGDFVLRQDGCEILLEDGETLSTNYTNITTNG